MVVRRGMMHAWQGASGPWFTSLAETVAGLRSWRRAGIAFLSGAFTVLALAPFHLWFVPFLTVPVLIWLLDGADIERRAAGRVFIKGYRIAGFGLPDFGAVKRHAVIGWAFGFGYFFAGLYWIGAAFLVEADKFAWAMPFAVSLLPGGLALFFGAACAVAGFFWQRGASRTVTLALALGLSEWVRGHILTGFPWNALGYTITGHDALLQAASIVGVYGLGFVAMLAFALPAVFATPAALYAKELRPLALVHMLAVGVLLVSAFVYGTVRLSQAKTDYAKGVHLKIVQPNIPQTEKWQPGNRDWIFQRYLDLSQRDQKLNRNGLGGTTHVIWPESAMPFLIARDGPALEAINALLPEGTSLITGAIRIEDDEYSANRIGRHKVFNSLFVFDDEARAVAIYDKIHLVPFGEYLPFQDVLEWIGLEQLTRVRGGFTGGTGPRVVRAPGAPLFSPLICYEIIFPGDVAESDQRPSWLLNVTNDAWYGNSTGPYQHLHQARVRAVEEGLPVIRAANTGVSAIIDPFGRIEKFLLLNRRGVLEGPLPKSLSQTLFSQYGNVILVIFSLILSLYAVLSYKISAEFK